MASKGYLIRYTHISSDLGGDYQETHARAVSYIGQFEGEMTFVDAIRFNDDGTWDDVSTNLIQEYFNEYFFEYEDLMGEEITLRDVKRKILPRFPSEHHDTIIGCFEWASDELAQLKTYGSYRDDVEATWSAGRL